MAKKNSLKVVSSVSAGFALAGCIAVASTSVFGQVQAARPVLQEAKSAAKRINPAVIGAPKAAGAEASAALKKAEPKVFGGGTDALKAGKLGASQKLGSRTIVPPLAGDQPAGKSPEQVQSEVTAILSAFENKGISSRAVNNARKAIQHGLFENGKVVNCVRNELGVPEAETFANMTEPAVEVMRRDGLRNLTFGATINNKAEVLLALAQGLGKEIKISLTDAKGRIAQVVQKCPFHPELRSQEVIAAAALVH